MQIQAQVLDPSWLLSVGWAGLLLVQLLLTLFLSARQARHVALHRGQVPSALAPVVSLAAHQKAADYTLAKLRLGTLQAALETAVLIGWTLLGGLSALNALWMQALGPGLLQDLALVTAWALIGGLIGLPLSLWRTFGLEARFGFNKTRWSLWLSDALKGALLAALIGLPLLGAVLSLMRWAGPWGWLWAWGVWAGFNLLLMVVFPLWIAPWFNRFTPLQDAALVERVSGLLERCGFRAQGVFVMDGSRRSAHANAYFTGLGQAKRVVFFDTLLARLTPAEVEAVLAHELGHAHHRHVLWRLIVSLTVALAALALLGALLTQTWFYTGLGVWPNVASDSHALALLLFGMTVPTAWGLLAPLGAAWSRRQEFQADAYASAHTHAADLRSALLKLYEDNAATLTPDPWFEAFYASHPGALTRLARLPADTPALTP